MKTFVCRKCGIVINEHNQFLHDGMCDECFFETYFPEDIEIFETDPEKLPRLCEEKEDVNLVFYRYIKDDRLNNRRFHNIVKEVEKRIDCKKCGNCCKQLYPDIIPNDIKRITSHLGISKASFVKKYLIKNEDGTYRFKKKPCVFLHQNKCKIYHVRPHECKKYPHLQKDISTRTIQFFANAEICPIVYNVLENSKIIFIDDIFGINKDVCDLM